MSTSDPIVDEVRRIRDAHAAKFNYDANAIFRDIKEKEKSSGRKYVSFADESAEPNKVVPSVGPTSMISEDIATPRGGSVAGH